MRAAGEIPAPAARSLVGRLAAAALGVTRKGVRILAK